MTKQAIKAAQSPADAVKMCVALLVGEGRSEAEATSICSVLPGLDAQPESMDAALWAKVSQFSRASIAAAIPAEVNYRKAEGTANCGACAFFQAGLCTKFADSPVATDWTCDAFAAKSPEVPTRMRATVNFKSVEIARTGSFDASTGPVTFTTEDFENAEAAYKALSGKHRATIKLGHNDKQDLLEEDGLPNAGFVANVRASEDGETLLADLVDVPDGVAQLVEDGRLNARSIEALRNANIAGKKWPFVITGLALLGEHLPAVDSLADVAALYASKGLAFPTSADGQVQVIAAVTKTASKTEAVVDAEALIAGFQSLLEQAENVIKRQGGAPKLRALAKAAVDELRTIAKKQTLRKGASRVELKDLAKKMGLAETATQAEVDAALAAAFPPAEEPDGDEEPKTKASKGDLEGQLVEARQRIVVLETKDAVTEATAQVEAAIKAGKFAPASQATLVRLAVASPKEFAALMKATPDNAIMAKVGKTMGGAGDGSGADLGELEPTEAELSVGLQLGITREAIIVTKARALGMKVPEAIAATYATQQKS